MRNKDRQQTYIERIDFKFCCILSILCQNLSLQGVVVMICKIFTLLHKRVICSFLLWETQYRIHAPTSQPSDTDAKTLSKLGSMEMKVERARWELKIHLPAKVFMHPSYNAQLWNIIFKISNEIKTAQIR